MRLVTSAAATVLTMMTLACGGGDTAGSDGRDPMRSDTPGMNSAADAGRPASESMQTAGATANRASVTGCLLAGGEAGSFVLQLASANPTGGAADRPQMSAGTWAPGATYNIVAASGQDLASHLNTMVAIEGPFISNTAGTSGTTTGTDRPRDDNARDRRADTSDSAGAMHTVRAESVRRVAEQCAAGTNRDGSSRPR